MVSTYDQSGAFDTAKCWADLIGCIGTERCLLLERLMGNSKARTVIFYSQELPMVPGADEMPINSVMHLPVGKLAVRSLAQVKRGVRTTDAAPSEWQSGTVSGTAAAQSPPKHLQHLKPLHGMNFCSNKMTTSLKCGQCCSKMEVRTCSSGKLDCQTQTCQMSLRTCASLNCLIICLLALKNHICLFG